MSKKNVSMLVTIGLLLLTMLPTIQPVAQAQNRPIITDKNFIFSSAFNRFDAAQFLQEQKSGLVQARVPFNGSDQLVADVVMFYAHYYGINPQVLFTFIELQSGLVTNPQVPNVDAVNQAIGYQDQQDFAAQMDKLAQELASAYYAHKTSADASSNTNSATQAIRQALSTLPNQSTNDAREGGFAQIFSTLFGDHLADNLAMPVALPPPPTFVLPFSGGIVWYYTSGPHNYNGGDRGCTSGPGCPRPWSSLDFSPGGGTGCDWTSWSQVRPAAVGTVIYAANNLIRIHHGDINQPAWETTYFHIRDIQVASGQYVDTNTNLGYPSCLGGAADGVHQHFSFLYDGEFQNAHARLLSRWRVAETTHYNGTMSRDGITKTASVNKTNDNAVTRQVALIIKNCTEDKAS